MVPGFAIALAAAARRRTVRVMVAPDSAESHEFRQMRNDVDDGYALLESIEKSVTTISATQRRHGNRLEEIEQSVDLQIQGSWMVERRGPPASAG